MLIVLILCHYMINGFNGGGEKGKRASCMPDAVSDMWSILNRLSVRGTLKYYLRVFFVKRAEGSCNKLSRQLHPAYLHACVHAF